MNYESSLGAISNESRRVLSQSLLLTGLMMIPTAVGVYIGSIYTIGLWSLLFIVLSVIGCVVAVGYMDKHNGMRLPVVGIMAVLMGAMLSIAINKVLTLANGSNIILSAVGASAATFVSASIYGATTKRDISSIGSMLGIALIGLIVVGIINIFLGSSLLSLMLACVGVVVFTLMTVYDINRIVTGGETDPVLAAVGLYLNIVNLFLDFLKIFTAFDD